MCVATCLLSTHRRRHPLRRPRHDSSKPAPLLMAYSSFSRSVEVRRKLGSCRGQAQAQERRGAAWLVLASWQGGSGLCHRHGSSQAASPTGSAACCAWVAYSCQTKHGARPALSVLAQVEAVGRRSTSLPPTAASREAPQSTCRAAGGWAGVGSSRTQAGLAAAADRPGRSEIFPPRITQAKGVLRGLAAAYGTQTAPAAQPSTAAAHPPRLVDGQRRVQVLEAAQRRAAAAGHKL